MPFSDALSSLLGGPQSPAALVPPAPMGYGGTGFPTIQGLAQAPAFPTIQGLQGAGEMPSVYGYTGFEAPSIQGLRDVGGAALGLPTIPALEMGVLGGVLKPAARAALAGQTTDATSRGVQRPEVKAKEGAQEGASRATAPEETTGLQLSGLGPGQRDEFFRRAMRLGLVMEQRTGIPAEVFAAMFANESNFGNAPGNIAGGVKAAPNAPGAVYLQTWEQGPNGERIPMGQWFQGSPTALAGMELVARNLQAGRYAPAYQALTSGQIDRDEFLRRVNAAGYATNTNWAQGEIVPLMGEASRYREMAIAANAEAAAPRTATAVGTRTAEQVQGANQNEYAARAGLSRAVAAAICGPVAADAFARRMGRMPDTAEAFNMARDQGMWDLNSGMHGPQAVVRLLGQLGAPAQMVSPTEERLGAEIQRGHPVILDTPGHYYYAAGYNPENHTFLMTDAVGANRWMTLGQVSALKYGAIRTAIVPQ